MDIKLNGKTLLGIAMISSSIVLADYVSIVNVKDSGGINVTGGVTETQLNTAIQTAVEEVKAAYDIKIAELEAGELPVGSITMWSQSTPPDGWLELDGTSVPTQYTDLIALIGATLPDYRGEFVRGWDNSRGVDSDRGLNDYQSSQIEDHKHASPFVYHASNIVLAARSGTASSPWGYGIQSREGISGRRYLANPTGDTTNTTSSFMLTSKQTFENEGETRPRNISAMYIIKAQ